MVQVTRSAALDALAAFVPNAGRDYAAGRNFDNGPGNPTAVSRLSPWIRNRLLCEWEVIAAVLDQHSPSAAAKFIDEVCWRTYWKGWLELRPGVWTDYRESQTRLVDEFASHGGYRQAIKGRTGIDCFDAWAAELVETGYLHNHARMWIASIWVHTLRLPWELGADWFLRHLLDGDPASNTLSWRWVAGLHTRGKTYLARPDNIRKYTNGRFGVETPLADHSIELSADPPPPQALAPLPPLPSNRRLGLLVTDEDVSAHLWLNPSGGWVAVAGWFPRTAYTSLNIAQPVTEFRLRALKDNQTGPVFESVDALIDWVEANQLDAVVMANPPVGPWHTILPGIETALNAHGKALLRARHWWDEWLYPHATHGFFRFKKAIPKALERVRQGDQIRG